MGLHRRRHRFKYPLFRLDLLPPTILTGTLGDPLGALSIHFRRATSHFGSRIQVSSILVVKTATDQLRTGIDLQMEMHNVKEEKLDRVDRLSVAAVQRLCLQIAPYFSIVVVDMTKSKC